MLGFLLVSLLMHPVHETVSEIEWNSETGRLEVALRLDALDEQWLRKRLARPPQAKGVWETTYLRDRFRIAPPPEQHESDSTTYRWIGRDEEKGHVWWYFEIEPADKQPPTWIQQRLLFEKGENHTNRVLVLGAVPTRTVILTMQKPQAFLKQTDDDDESESAPQNGR